MSRAPAPHGGRLVDRLLRGPGRDRFLSEAGKLPRLVLDEERATDAINVARGAYSPLEGFNTSGEVASILAEGRLPSGLPWTFPILLPLGETRLRAGEEIALARADGSILGRLRAREVFSLDIPAVARALFGTTDAAHPGVARLARAGERFVAGPVDVPDNARLPFPELALAPAETRARFEAQGWRTVCGYQTRNPPHRAHEFLHKVVMSITDGLFVQPAIGRKKPGDFRDEVIVDAYRALLSEYYPAERSAFAILPYEMKYAGPREAVLHAILRKNYGCTHFVVGRDHAGVGAYYRPEAAIEYFDAFPDLSITPVAVRGDHFWCRLCGGVESERTCAHAPQARAKFSGTLLRELIARGETPPAQAMRPEVFAAILKHARPFVDDG